MEEKKKIKVLVTASDKSGVGHFRSIWPHQYIQEHFGDEFDCDIVDLKDYPKENLVDFLNQYDILAFHKMMDKECKVLELAKFLNLIVVCDVDDYWQLGMDHPLSYSSRYNHWPEIITKHLRLSDCVTTTNKLFADRIKLINPNVCVLENGIDNDLMPQFFEDKNPRPNGRVRFGILCGSTHLHDIELMKGISSLSKDVMDKIQLVQCGTDWRGTTTIFNKQTGQATVKPIERSQSVWARYMEFLTDNYKTVTPEHKAYLKSYLDGDDQFENDAFRSFATRPIQEYAKNYANLDVLLAPLKENDFNKYKSPLKVAECAYTNTALIASKFGPYTSDLTSYIEFGGKINPDANSLLVEPSKNGKNWAKYITFLANNQDVIPLLAKNLKRDVYEKYALKNITEKRVELYKKLYNEHNSQ